MKLYIFDLDGTLTNTLEAIAYFGNCALKTYNYDTIPVNDYRYLVGDGMDVLIHRMLKLQNADTESNFQLLRQKYDELYSNDTTYKTEPYDDIMKLLFALKARGNKLAVLSNKPHHVVENIVPTILGSDLFDMVLGQKSDTPKKPAPDNVYNIINSLNFNAEDCFFIGDTNVDIFTGKNANIKTIGVLWGFRDKEELVEAGADYIVSTPMEIAEIF